MTGCVPGACWGLGAWVVRLQQQAGQLAGPHSGMLLDTVCRVRLHQEAVGTRWKGLEVGVQRQMGFRVVPLEKAGRWVGVECSSL